MDGKTLMELTLPEKLTRTRPWPKGGFQLPTLQLHRGGHLYGEKENTLAALKKAQSLGAKMVEFDVRLTRDGQVILFHDDNLASIGEASLKVADVDFKFLRERAGCDLLRDVLVDKSLNLLLNIELKTAKALKFELEKKVIQILRDTETSGRVLFSSFNPLSLVKLAILAPHIPRALLVGANMPNHRLLEKMILAPAVPFHVLHLDKARLPTSESVALWKKRNVRLAVWTLTTDEEIKRYRNWGVDSVISDLFAL